MGTLGAALDSIHSKKKNNDVPKGDKIIPLHYSKLHRAPYQYSHKGKTEEEYEQEVRKLKDEIKAAGKVLQPLLVRKIDVDDYEIIGGQHRRDASELLVIEDGETQYEFCPCIIKNMSDAQAEYAGFSTNTNWEKSDWHIMHEIERKKYLLENYPEDFPNIPDKGRMIEKLAKEMNLSKSTVGEYLQISKNLSDNAMDSFETGELNKSAAVAMASLSHAEQDKLIDAGVTKQKDIKAYKEEKVEKTVHRTTVTDTVKTVKTHNVEEQKADKPIEEIAEVVDVLPGQYRVANTDMELEEEKENTMSDNFETLKDGRCSCKNCKLPSRIEDTFTFYGKGYCMNCLHDLIKDLADTGVITLDCSAVDTKGIVIHS